MSVSVLYEVQLFLSFFCFDLFLFACFCLFYDYVIMLFVLCINLCVITTCLYLTPLKKEKKKMKMLNE